MLVFWMNDSIINERDGTIVSMNVAFAFKCYERMLGLLIKDKLSEEHCLWIKPCCSIHTFGMKYPLDVIFLNKYNIVVCIRENVKPNRFCIPRSLCHSAIELSAGSINKLRLYPGDRLILSSSQL